MKPRTADLPTPQGQGTGTTTSGEITPPRATAPAPAPIPAVLSSSSAPPSSAVPLRARLGATSSPELRRATLHEAKVIAMRARYDSGITYECIGETTGRHLTHVYDALNPRNDVRTLSHSDLLAMSRSDRTRAFVARLLAPILANLRTGGTSINDNNGDHDH